MLKFTVKPGESFMIGDEIKVVFLGGMQNNCRVLVDAPKSYNIVRSSILEKNAASEEERKKIKHYYPEPRIDEETLNRWKGEQEEK